ncbi:hypothetical protein L1987_85121 [Smallanthus sonchifolius]|uniref:Uncharacterized protein n=1 Tax=Smallanthus sonchifolius TaxID=185202 RepID=A0ACB8XWP9_9ASTR|nr:hypothetical protein L1987_85121 [Smallanthus sonchifolius]
MLPNQCNLQSRQCQIGNIMTESESNIDIPFWPFGSDSGSDSRSRSQQCRESEIQRPVSQCQRYVQQQIRSPRTLLMSISRQGQQQGLQQCCNELQNVRRECQCEAVEEVARKVTRQQQQGGRRQYGGQQDEREMVRRVVQNLPNQCYLEAQLVETHGPSIQNRFLTRSSRPEISLWAHSTGKSNTSRLRSALNISGAV